MTRPEFWPDWFADMAEHAEDAGHDRYSAAWRYSIRDQYVARYPDADRTSADNLTAIAEDAARREAGYA